MIYLDTAAFEAAQVDQKPFPHLLVTKFISYENVARIAADFPQLLVPRPRTAGWFLCWRDVYGRRQAR